MTAKHTPGKLEVGDSYRAPLMGDKYAYVVSIPLGIGKVDLIAATAEQADIDATRLVACWNALDGLNPEKLAEFIKLHRKMRMLLGSAAKALRIEGSIAQTETYKGIFDVTIEADNALADLEAQ